MFFKKRYVRNSNMRCLEHIKANYKLLNDITWYACRYNNRCHMNSLREAQINKKWDILWVYIVDKWNNNIISHFVNKNNNNHKLLEVTLWNTWPVYYNYYLVRVFEQIEFYNADDPLISLKTSIFNIWFTNKFLNRFYRLDKNKLF